MMSEEQRARAPQRIEWTVIVLGFVCALAALALMSWKDAVGVLIGTAVAWLNFRWMRTSVTGLTDKLAQRPDTGGSTVALAAKFLLRYAVVFAAVYATLKGSVASVLGVFAGLLLIVPALTIEATYEFYLGRQPDTQVSNTPGPTE